MINDKLNKVTGQIKFNRDEYLDRVMDDHFAAGRFAAMAKRLEEVKETYGHYDVYKAKLNQAMAKKDAHAQQ